jgi:hypothetical protein
MSYDIRQGPNSRFVTRAGTRRLDCRVLLRQYRLGEAHPIARAERQHLVVKILVRIMQYSAGFGSAIANPDIGHWPLFEKAGKVLCCHARQQGALDIALGEEGSRGCSRDFGFRGRIDQGRVAPFVAELYDSALRRVYITARDGCSALTTCAAATTGSIARCSIAPCAPRPLIVISKMSKAAIGPGRTANWPAGTSGQWCIP